MTITGVELGNISVDDSVITEERAKSVTGAEIPVSASNTNSIAAILDSKISFSDFTQQVQNVDVLDGVGVVYVSRSDIKEGKLIPKYKLPSSVTEVSFDEFSGTGIFLVQVDASNISTTFTVTGFSEYIDRQLTLTLHGNAVYTFLVDTIRHLSKSISLLDSKCSPRKITCFVENAKYAIDDDPECGMYTGWKSGTTHNLLTWQPDGYHRKIMTLGMLKFLFANGYHVIINQSGDDSNAYAKYWTGANASVACDMNWELACVATTSTTALTGNDGAGAGFAWFAPVGGDTSWAGTARNYRINYRWSASKKDSSYAFGNVQFQYATMAISNFTFSGESDDSGL